MVIFLCSTFCLSSFAAGISIENKAIRLDFADKDAGFEALGIRNKLTSSDYPFAAAENIRRLFSIDFRPIDELNSNKGEVTVCERSRFRRLKCRRSGAKTTFLFEGYDFPGENDALDVRVTVELEPGEGASRWTLEYENRSKRLVGLRSTFPLLRRVLKQGEGDVLVPWSNHGARLLRKDDTTSDVMPRRDASYLGYKPMVTAFMKDGGGLYIAAEDPQARIKELTFRGEHDVYFYTPIAIKRPPEGVNGPGYSVTIAAFKGDWWQVARRYRKWATKQEWTAKGRILDRKDYPRRLCEIPFWVNIHSPTPGRVVNQLHALFPDFRIGLHWHQWHTPPHCTDYPEYFPPRPGVIDDIQVVKDANCEGNLYLDSQLWSEGVGDWETAKRFTCFGWKCGRDGRNFHTEVYGNGQIQAVMCPATAFWQKKVQEFSMRCLTELKSDSIYLDQTGAAPACTCYDSSHGHTLGGGTWWYEGYRKMLSPLHDATSKIGGVMTTEGTGEAYMANFDGYLTVTDLTNEDVPFYNAVYSGYTYYYGSPQLDSDDDDSFWAVQANEFLWGQAIGWYNEWVPVDDKQETVRRLCKVRMQFKDYFAYGQLLDEFRPLKPLDELSFVYHFRKEDDTVMRKKGLIGAVWQNGKTGKKGVCIVNVAKKPQRTLFDFPEGVTHMAVVPIADEEKPLYAEKKGRCAIQLAAKGICFLEEVKQ